MARAVARCGSLLVVVVRGGLLWVDVGGCGSLWLVVVVACCGLLWFAVAR